MKRTTARLLAIALGIATAAAVAEGAARVGRQLGIFGGPTLLQLLESSPPNAVEFDRLEAEIRPRQERALIELAQGEQPQWAGVYRTASTWPLRLVLAPKAGFTLYQDSSCGNCGGWRAAGAIAEASDSRVRLRPEVGCEDASESRWWWCRDEPLHFVRWGELQFAVPAGELQRFYVRANDGWSFPDALVRGLVVSDELDFEQPARPPGRPEIVSGFEHLVLKAPVDGCIVALLDLRPRVDPDDDGRETLSPLYSIDAGSERGLARGMRLFFAGSGEPATWWISVEDVETDTARVELHGWRIDRAAAEAVVGERVSSLHPKTLDAPR